MSKIRRKLITVQNDLEVREKYVRGALSPEGFTIDSIIFEVLEPEALVSGESLRYIEFGVSRADLSPIELGLSGSDKVIFNGGFFLGTEPQQSTYVIVLPEPELVDLDFLFFSAKAGYTGNVTVGIVLVGRFQSLSQLERAVLAQMSRG